MTGEEALAVFITDLRKLLAEDYTGNITVRVQRGVIRSYRTEHTTTIEEKCITHEGAGYFQPGTFTNRRETPL